MKQLIFITLFISSVAVYAQGSKNDLLVGVWKLSSDEMSGVGLHKSLSEDTELQFLQDGIWKSTQPLMSAREGTWRLVNNNKTLLMNIDNEEVKYLIMKVTEKELHYRLKKNAATYNYLWTAKISTNK